MNATTNEASHEPPPPCDYVLTFHVHVQCAQDGMAHAIASNMANSLMGWKNANAMILAQSVRPGNALSTAPEQAAPVYTYASTQATKCASCGEQKHTPLRIDAMDGYVCLTCIDNKLGELLGEFGYPQQAAAVPAEVAETVAEFKSRLIVEACSKWSGSQKVEAGDIIEWIADFRLAAATQARAEPVAWMQSKPADPPCIPAAEYLTMSDAWKRHLLSDPADTIAAEFANSHDIPLMRATPQAVTVQSAARETCEWSQDGNEDGSWFSACGGAPWHFEADDPTKNGMRHCIHCGKRMVQHGITGEAK